MADLFLEIMAGAVGDPVDFTEKLEGGIPAWDTNGTGEAWVDDPGRTAYVFNRYLKKPGRPDYGASIKARFDNAAASGRGVRLCMDVVDKDNYVYVDFRSGYVGGGWAGLGKPEVAIGRVVGGVDTVLDGPHSYQTPALTNGVKYMVEVVRTRDPASDVRTWELRFDHSWTDSPRQPADVTYVHDPAVDGPLSHANNGSLGFRNSVFCNQTDIEIDDLRCFELSTAAQDASDRRLTVGPDTLDGDEMKAAKVSPVELNNGYNIGAEFTFKEAVSWENASWRPELYVEWRDAGGIRFRGYIHEREFGGGPGAEVVTYRCRGRKARMRYVTAVHPTTLSSRLIWNGEVRDYLNSADRTAFTVANVGEAIEWYFDTFEDELRDVGAIRNDAADPFSAAEIAALSMPLLRTEVEGDVMQQITALLSQFQAYAFAFANGSDLYRFTKVTALPPVALQPAADLLAASSLTEDSTGVYSQVCIHSIVREREEALATVKGGDLNEDWDSTLDQYWSPEKARRRMIGATVTAVLPGAGPGGEDRITVDYDNPPRTYPGEWANGQVRFTSGAATGDEYPILTQAAGAVAPYAGDVTIDGNWTTPPAVTDDLVLEVIPAKGQFNGFANVYRRFKIADPNKQNVVGVEEGGCPQLKMVTPSVDVGSSSNMEEAEVKPFFNAAGPDLGGIVSFDALVGTEATAAKPAQCNVEGSYENPDDQGGDVQFDYEFWKTTILQRCKSNAGPYPDWPGRTLVIEESEFRDASQNSIVDARAQEILDAVSILQFIGRPEFVGLNYDFVDLLVSLSISSPSRTLPFAAATILPVQVVYRYSANSEGDRTYLDLGGPASFAASGQKFATELKADTALERLRETQRKLLDLQNCVRQETDGGQGPVGNSVGARSQQNQQTCRMRTNLYDFSPPKRIPGPSVPKELEAAVEWLLDNKDTLDDDVAVVENQTDGLLHNQGKTTEGDGNVLDGGSTVPAGGATYHSPGGGDVAMGPGETVPLTVDEMQQNSIDGILANLGKTVDDATGEVLAPGTVLAAGQTATTHNPDGTTTSIPSGGTVPENEIGRIQANKEATADALATGHDPGEQDGATDPSALGAGVLEKSGSGGWKLRINPDGTTTLVPGSGQPTDGPIFGGGFGTLFGKCGTTLGAGGNPYAADGAASAVGPGSAIGAGKAVYYAPDQAGGVDPTAHVLPSGGFAPTSTLDLNFNSTKQLYGVTLFDASDPAGVVFDG